MKTTVSGFAVVAAVTVAVVGIGLLCAQSPRDSGSKFVDEIPAGYRDWKLISIAHEEGNLHSFAAVLGNEAAVDAYRANRRPFPDGSIIAALHYSHVSSEENNRAFGQSQSFVPGAPTNIQFMVKDSRKYAATGGWGFGHFQDGKPADAGFMRPCFPCHEKTRASDFVFTRYIP